MGWRPGEALTQPPPTQPPPPSLVMRAWREGAKLCGALLGVRSRNSGEGGWGRVGVHVHVDGKNDSPGLASSGVAPKYDFSADARRWEQGLILRHRLRSGTNTEIGPACLERHTTPTPPLPPLTPPQGSKRPAAHEHRMAARHRHCFRGRSRKPCRDKAEERKVPVFLTSDNNALDGFLCIRQPVGCTFVLVHPFFWWSILGSQSFAEQLSVSWREGGGVQHPPPRIQIA